MTALGADVPKLSPSYFDRYAENIYADLARFAEQDVTFEVSTTETANAKALGPTTLSMSTGRPSHSISSDVVGNQFIAVAFGPASKSDPAESSKRLDEFEVEGLPLRLGTVRALLVTAKIGDQSRQHRAMEVCWNDLRFCRLYDPTIAGAEKSVKAIRKYEAEMWTPDAGSKAGRFHTSRYAENLYADYAKMADADIEISIGVLRHDSGAVWKNRPLSELVGTPYVELNSRISAYQISGLKFVPATIDGHEMARSTLATLAPKSLDLNDASLRQLRVRTTLGKQTFEHEAVEVCWASMNFCRVFDPSARYLEGNVKSLRAAFARPTPPIERLEVEGGKATCTNQGLASWFVTEDGYTDQVTRGTIRVGKITYGMGCKFNTVRKCHATGVSASASASSASANEGYSVKCDYAAKATYGGLVYSPQAVLLAGTGCGIGARTAVFDFTITGTYANTELLLRETMDDSHNAQRGKYSCIKQ